MLWQSCHEEREMAEKICKIFNAFEPFDDLFFVHQSTGFWLVCADIPADWKMRVEYFYLGACYALKGAANS